MVFGYKIKMKIVSAFLVLLLISGIVAQRNDAILALSWLNGFCQWAKDCRQNTVDAWDHQSFTIHGYWPQSHSKRYFGDFDLDLIDDDLLAEMKNYWPPQSRSTHDATFLWEHEYNKHGSDFDNIYLQQHKSEFAHLSTEQQNDKLQPLSFKYIIDLYKTLDVQKIPKSRYTKSEFAKQIGVQQNQFSLVCNEGSGTLQEIRICFDITPAKSVLTKCKSVSARNCKNNEVVLGGWRQSSAKSPVTKV